MKKRNFCAIAAFAFVIAIFAGCKSTKVISEDIASDKSVKAVKIEPLLLLDSGFAIYFRIPVAQNKDFVMSLLRSNVGGISEADAKLIAEHLEVVCAGMDTDNNMNVYQIAASGFIPKIAVKSALSENKGWIKRTEPVTYYTRAGSEYQLALPTTANMLLAKDVEPLVENYKFAAANETETAPPVPVDMYEWLCSSAEDIHFCVLKPQAFLARLLGVDMRFALQSVKGAFAIEEDNYILSLEMAFQKSQVIKAALAALTLAFGTSDQVSFQSNSNVLKVNGIHVDKSRVFDLLGL